MAIDFANRRSWPFPFSDIRCERLTRRTALDLAGNVVSFDENVLGITDRGLIGETGATNVALHSNDLAQAAWTRTAFSVTSQSGGPLGTFNRLAMPAGVALKSFYNTAVYSPILGAATRSMFVRANGGVRWIAVSSSAATTDGVFFDLVSGAVGSAFGGAVGRLENVGGGWYRVSAHLSAGAPYVYCTLHSANGVATSYNAAGTETLDVAGVQAETGSIATSYIPTAGTAASRAFDNMWLPLGPWWNASEAIFVATVRNLATANNAVVVALNASASTEREAGFCCATPALRK